MKRVIGVVLAVALLCVTFSALAQTGDYLSIENVLVSQDGLRMVLHGNRLTDATNERLVVTLNGESVTPSALTRLDETDLNTSFVFLLDCSSTMKASAIEDAKEIATLLLGNMKRGDNAVVAAAGEPFTTAELTTDASVLVNAVGALERKKEKTDLYQSIQACISFLNNNNRAKMARCLVVFSNGADNSATGLDRTEITKFIAEAGFPVHVVALVQKDDKQAALNEARTLCGFARASGGGMDITLGLDKTTPEAVALQVLTRMKETYLLTCTVGQQVTGKYDVAVFLADGDETLSATQSTWLTFETDSAPTIEDKEIVYEETEKDIVTQEENNPYSILALGVVVLVGAVLLLYVLLRKKGHSPPAEPDTKPQPEVESMMEPEQEPEQTQGDEQPQSVVILKPRYHIVLTELSQNGAAHAFDVEAELRIGRSAGHNDLCLHDDPKISNAHCVIEMKDEQAVLKDLNSTNGTRLNGVPIQQPMPLAMDDVIQVGKHSLRIFWSALIK